ncbi:hypothetical protein LEMLEM_LOCUS22499, partial [Lemmus lemmus]
LLCRSRSVHLNLQLSFTATKVSTRVFQLALLKITYLFIHHACLLIWFKDGEIAQFVRCIPSKAEDLRFSMAVSDEDLFITTNSSISKGHLLPMLGCSLYCARFG